MIQVIVLSLFGALMPSRLFAVGSLLTTRRPIVNSVGFWLACTFGYVAMALVISSAVADATPLRRVSEKTVIELELLLGVLLLGFATLTVLTGDAGTRRARALVEGLHAVSTGQAIGAGLAAGVLGLRNVLILLIVAGGVAHDGYGVGVLMAALLCAILVFSLPMIVPIAVYLRDREQNSQLLSRAQPRLLAASRRLSIWLGFAAGGFLITQAILRMPGR